MNGYWCDEKSSLARPRRKGQAIANVLFTKNTEAESHASGVACPRFAVQRAFKN
jgi:hypothetical protein